MIKGGGSVLSLRCFLLLSPSPLENELILFVKGSKIVLRIRSFNELLWYSCNLPSNLHSLEFRGVMIQRCTIYYIWYYKLENIFSAFFFFFSFLVSLFIKQGKLSDHLPHPQFMFIVTFCHLFFLNKKD